MKKSKFTDNQIKDVVQRFEAGFGVLEISENWASASPPFINGEPNMAAWTFQRCLA